tara:strand:- start:4661 stop:4861 length:201 start_codon:yes stop_codon:yes gene_type:complete
MTKKEREHGSPRDRGSADRYYGRLFEPHYYPNGTYKGRRVTENDMSPEQVSEYTLGWEEETDRKDW